MMRVLLVNPDVDSSESAAAQACFPPLGLVQIGSVVDASLPWAEVRIHDVALTGGHGLDGDIAWADVVGISVLTTTLQSALNIAKASKAAGRRTVAGNDHASRFARSLATSGLFDAVLVGDYVDFSFTTLLSEWRNGRPGGPLAGLTMQLNDGTVIESPPLRFELSRLPLPNYGLLSNADGYADNFSNRFARFCGQRRPATVNVVRGCARFKRPCSFCDIFDLSLASIPPAQAWNYLSHVAGFGFDYLWEVCDSFTSNSRWLEEFARLAPSDPEFSLFVYGRAQEIIRPGVIDMLRSAHVSRVNIGMESGSDTILRAMKKGNTEGASTNLKAARMLVASGIQIHASLIIGSPGESEQSLRETELLIDELIAGGATTSVDLSILYPLPGAPVWRQGEEAGLISMSDDFGLGIPSDIRSRFVERFCRGGLQDLEAFRHRALHRVANAGLIPGGFG